MVVGELLVEGRIDGSRNRNSADGSQEFGKMENMGGMMEGLGGIDPSQASWVIVSFLVFSAWLDPLEMP